MDITLINLKLFFQNTHSYHLTMIAVNMQTRDLKTRMRFASACLMGMIEVITYVSLVCFNKMFTADQIHSRRYWNWSKGAIAACMISFIGLGDPNKAIHIQRHAETSIDQECKELIKKSERNLKKKIQESRRQYLSKMRRESQISPRMRIADWEELSKPVWNQMEFVIKRLDNRYAKAHSWEKFEALDEAHSSIATLAKAVNDLYTQTTCT
jgi:hypothetical protein